MNPARRRLFRPGPPDHCVPRMPWLDGARFLQHCTVCRACIDACPEGIVSAGDGGLPAIDFARGGCTFCGHCADACPEHLFTSRDGAPWAHRVTIGERCLTLQGVVCQSCRDVCEPGAITFTPRLGAVATPRLDTARCTACGACTAVCPTQAIGWTLQTPATTHDEAPTDACQ